MLPCGAALIQVEYNPMKILNSVIWEIRQTKFPVWERRKLKHKIYIIFIQDLWRKLNVWPLRFRCVAESWCGLNLI